ncbi:MAG: NrfD/PsrC family molybdoenzyme membrane anchor subunit [Pyrobaculum sp.]
MTAFQHIWDPLLIGPFLWFAGIAGMTSVAYVLLKWLGVEERRRELSIVIFISYILATAFVVADLARPWNVVNAITASISAGTFGITRSWMAVGIVLLFVGILLSLLMVLRNVGVKTLRILDGRWFDVIVAFIGIGVTVYSGFLIAAAPGIPFWNTALLPLLWIISASVCALAVVKLFVHSLAPQVVARFGISLDIAKILALLAFISTALYGGSKAAQISAYALTYGQFAPTFWGGVMLIGVLIPLAIYAATLKRDVRTLGIVAAVLALVGALILRIVVLQAGVFETPVPA